MSSACWKANAASTRERHNCRGANTHGARSRDKLSFAEIRFRESLLTDSLDSDLNRARTARFPTRFRKKFLHGESLLVGCFSAVSRLRFVAPLGDRLRCESINWNRAEVLILCGFVGAWQKP